MRINRFYELEKLIKKGKVLIIYGARQVGKTTFVEDFLSKTKLKYRFDSGDNIKVQNILNSEDFEKIIEYVGNNELLIIDEAQNIEKIGIGLKIIIDQIKNIYVIATGSSSFDLANKTGEPLTGRKRTITLYPISQVELLEMYGKFELKEKLDHFVIFGSYPEVITAKNKTEKIEILNEIINSYLLKDILSLERVKGSKIILDLLKLLAFQIGSEVSLNELANNLNIDVKTVQRYLDLLEKAFIIKTLSGFSRNLRSEINRKNKYYFLDNGIRNGVISQYNELEDRNDIGQLWENFLIVERLKKCSYKKIYGSMYFWRTYSGQEIDLIEERDAHLYGFEFKWRQDKFKEPKEFLETYKNSSIRLINTKNYLDFIT